MLDRLTNLLVLFVLAAAIIILAFSLRHAWITTQSWEKEWVAKPGVNPAYSADRIIVAIKKAKAAGEYGDVYRLEEFLESNYKTSDVVLVRFSLSELSRTAIYFVMPLLLLMFPLSLNYVRHGKFRFWNRGT